MAEAADTILNMAEAVDPLAQDPVLDATFDPEYVELLEGMHDDEVAQKIKQDKIMKLTGYHYYQEKRYFFRLVVFRLVGQNFSFLNCFGFAFVTSLKQ